ncbi:MAG TPA: hypothetical protein PK175_03995 [Syntrophales bacterium]|jgi:hypothetical protein|nr:hypothetical protein [Syntrophales bacterium]HON23955.1 hypothetical protein [Syntrophales bacterium]HOU76995.1 hypothetical protein [Syntrophales bacterium]HPC32275.1 hypothetical protein [Syntrophales bacterium]HQG34017.1 hypothetical protein [Syntrophales bacterium]
MIKKLLAIIMVIMLSGCFAAIKESEWGKHDSVYQDLGHLWFSWIGYRDVDQRDVEKSTSRGWWGIPKPYYPDTKKTN